VRTSVSAGRARALCAELSPLSSWPVRSGRMSRCSSRTTDRQFVDHMGQHGSPPSTQVGKARRRRPRNALLAICAVAVCLLLASLEAAHLVRISAYEPQYLPVCRIGTARKFVSLTFDDGPDPAYSSRVIALLERYEGHGTFFVIGSRAKRYPALVAAESAAGMELGNHTWSHARLKELSTRQAVAQVERAEVVLSEAGVRSGLFRAPFGDISADQSRALARSRLIPIHWSLAIDHYVGELGMSPSDAADSLARVVRGGDIILAHDARIGSGENTEERIRAFETLVLLLPRLRASGFRFVPVGDLLSQGSRVRATPRPWFWQSGFSCPQ
jgi:peptidoglycan/xylan/chitin deacetylase (PgdA/CDA1 family)